MKIKRGDTSPLFLYFNMFKEKVAQLIQQAMDENPSLFLIELDIQGNNEIRVIIDGDDGVTVEDCHMANT